MAIYADVSDIIGQTPLVRLRRLSEQVGAELIAKLEGGNPAGSVKDRVARAMIDEAERTGVLQPGATIVEPTSGNTGIALAMIAAARGYRMILTMPEAMSKERVRLLRAYGAEVVLTPGTLMKAAVEQAMALGDSIPGAVMLKQFENPANPRAHQETTGPEIWRDTEGSLDVFVAGIGTGGTVTGVARALKPKLPKLTVVGVEPSSSPVLSGGEAGQHHIQGIGAGFVPPVLDLELVDRLEQVSEEQALAASRQVVRSDGILCGISSGAALAAALRLAVLPEFQGKRFVVMFPDTGERYVTTALFRGLSS